MCGITDYKCKAGEVASSAVGDAIDKMASAVVEAFEKAAASLGTVWMYIGTPNLTRSGSEESAVEAGTTHATVSGNVESALSYVTWIGLGVAVLSLIALGAHLALSARRGSGGMALGRLGITLSAVVLISGSSSLVAGFMPNAPEKAGGAVLFLQSGLWWPMGAAAVLSVIFAGIRMIWTQRADAGKDLVQSVLTLIVVAGASTTIIALLVTAADKFSIWILDKSLDCEVLKHGTCFAGNITAMLALTTNPATPGLGPLLIIILGLIAILCSLIQVVLMVARGGMLVILAGILPLSASFTNTEMGKQWFKRAIGWLVAFILYKPAAAIVYAAAFQLVGTNVFDDDGTGMLAVLTGLVLMVLALFAMPALMKFVTPMVSQTSGGGSGGMAGAAALAALPMGASAAGKLSGMVGGGGGGSGPSGPSSSSSSSAPPSGSTETGGSPSSSDAPSAGAPPSGSPGPEGSSDTSDGSPGPEGPSGGGGSDAPGGTTATGGTETAAAGGETAAGAGGGTAAGAGGGAAAGAGGGAAAGAAAGPAGAAAGAAAQAAAQGAQAAAGAAQSVGEEATGEEGGGPSGGQ